MLADVVGVQRRRVEALIGAVRERRQPRGAGHADVRARGALLRLRLLELRPHRVRCIPLDVRRATAASPDPRPRAAAPACSRRGRATPRRRSFPEPGLLDVVAPLRGLQARADDVDVRHLAPLRCRSAVTRSNSCAAASASSALRRFGAAEREAEVRLTQRRARAPAARPRCRHAPPPAARAPAPDRRARAEVERPLGADEDWYSRAAFWAMNAGSSHARVSGLLYVTVEESRIFGSSAACACVSSSAADPLVEQRLLIRRGLLQREMRGVVERTGKPRMR